MNPEVHLSDAEVDQLRHETPGIRYGTVHLNNAGMCCGGCFYGVLCWTC